MKKNKNLKVSIIMGSQSDYKTMKSATKILKKMGIKFETKIISAHRTPQRMYEYARSAVKNNVKRFVMTSSFSAIGAGSKEKELDDTNWTDLDNPHISPYDISKTKAEMFRNSADQYEQLIIKISQF